jgi:ubiquinone biosynthesis protein
VNGDGARQESNMPWDTLTAARDVGRLHEIASVLVRFGFSDAVARVGLSGALERAGHLLHAPRREARSAPSSPVRLRQAMETLGPTFVKLGQVLASRADLFGPDWIAEFERLQNHAPCVPFETLRPILEQRFGGPLEESIGAVDPVPLAAASIAQVHRATLHDGAQVVVKVRRPGIEATIGSDLRLLERLARAVEAHSPEAARYRPSGIVRQFRHSIERELDLAAECHHAERIAAAMATVPGLVIPRVYWQWTADCVNLQQFLPGRPLQDMLEPGMAEAEGANLPRLALLGTRAILQMVFVDGFFHADPHGANVLYLPGDRIGLIDFGMVGRLSPGRRRQLVALLHALVQSDAEAVARVLDEWAGEGEPDRELFLDDIERFLDRYHGVALGRIDLGAMLGEVVAIIRNHGLALPPDLAMVFKVFITLEGLGRRLDPAFDMVGAARPFIERVLRERYSRRYLAGRVRHALVDSAEALAAMPEQLQRLLRSMGEGRLSLRMDVGQLQVFGEQVGRSANRLALGLIISALIIGSSIVLAVHGGSRLLGLQFFGMAGFVVALVGGAWLLISILRSGGGR